MTTIDPTDEDAEEQMEEKILEMKREGTKYGSSLNDE